MCGIAGWIDWKHPRRDGDLLRAMTRAISHRGPDGEGYYEVGPANLGHRRLSIIDLEGGAQPMANEDETIWVVFNGEIYNFQEIRQQLIDRGHKFRTNSDTEVIVHLYEDMGANCVRELRGQFAFAVWDSRKRELILARDRLGQKPLYYCPQDGRFLFASELKSILKDPSVSRDIDVRALDAYFAYRFVPEPFSILESVKKLPPAHVMIASEKGCKQHRYWHAAPDVQQAISARQAAEQLDGLLEEATRLRMIADVPVGAFLSGGIDSSLIVAYMQRVATRRIKTFSIGFEEQSHDERVYARQVAERFQTDHHEFVVKPNAVEVLPKIVEYFDEPFADESAIAVYYLSQMTREKVTVALNGDGADEFFGGYRRYKGAVQFERFRNLPDWMQRSAVRLAQTGCGGPLKDHVIVRRLLDWHGSAKLGTGAIYEKCMTIPPETRLALYSNEMGNALAAADGEMVARFVDEFPQATTLARVMYADQNHYLPGDLLVKVDRMTMAHSLEGRSPFLDHRVAEFATTLPDKIKFKRMQSKYLLKQALSQFFPRKFVHRTKMGFGVPVADWLRGELKPLVTEAIENSHLARDGYFDPESIRRVLREHTSGIANRKRPLWSLLMLEAWYRKTIEEVSPHSAAA